MRSAAERAHPGEDNLLDKGALDDLGPDYDYVIHLAALLGVQNVRNRPYEVLTLNNAMLQRVIDFARRQQRLSRLLFSSTSEVYGGTLRYFGMPVPTPESTPLAVNDLAEPRTSYMLSKIYGEALCRHSGLPITIVPPAQRLWPADGPVARDPRIAFKARHLAASARLEVFSVEALAAPSVMFPTWWSCWARTGADGLQRETLNVGNQSAELSIGELARIVLETWAAMLKSSPSGDARAPRAARAGDVENRGPGWIPQPWDIRDGVRRTYGGTGTTSSPVSSRVRFGG
jgi:nucleoside-diphosphate-sugar epimerase